MCIRDRATSSVISITLLMVYPYTVYEYVNQQSWCWNLFICGNNSFKYLKASPSRFIITNLPSARFLCANMTVWFLHGQLMKCTGYFCPQAPRISFMAIFLCSIKTGNNYLNRRESSIVYPTCTGSKLTMTFTSPHINLSVICIFHFSRKKLQFL